MLSTFKVNTTLDTVAVSLKTGKDATGHISLRSAIMAANAKPNADTIIVPAGTFTLTIPGADEDADATGDLDINGSVTIKGKNSQATIIDGNNLDRVIEVLGGKVSISNLTIQHGRSIEGAGLLNQGGNVTLTSVNVANNLAIGANGASGAAGTAGGNVGNDGGIGGVWRQCHRGRCFQRGAARSALKNSVIAGNRALGGNGGNGGAGGEAERRAGRQRDERPIGGRRKWRRRRAGRRRAWRRCLQWRRCSTRPSSEPPSRAIGPWAGWAESAAAAAWHLPRTAAMTILELASAVPPTEAPAAWEAEAARARGLASKTWARRRSRARPASFRPISH